MADRRETSGVEKVRSLDLRLEARPENVPRVRRALERLGMPTSLVDDANLLASEVVSNSIRHSGLRPDEFLQITAHWSGRTLRVTVRDRLDSAGRDPVAGSIRPSPGAESGWGLYLVERLASRWGTSFDGGPGYWFELELPAQSETI